MQVNGLNRERPLMSSQIYDILGIDLELLMVQKKNPKEGTQMAILVQYIWLG